MNCEKRSCAKTAGVAKSFSAPLFLVIAICISVLLLISIVSMVLSALDTLEMLESVPMPEEVPISEIVVGTVSTPALLGVIFLVVSTICAWLLYAKGYSQGKVLNVRLHLAYSKIMNTIAIVFVCIFGAILVAACVSMTIVSDMISDDVLPWLEEEIRPALDEIIEYKNEIEKSEADFDKMFAEMDDATKESLGITNAQEMKDIFMDVGEFAETLDNSWDDIMDFIQNGFMTLTIIVAAAYVLVIVGLCFVSSALKRTSKYLRALSEDEYTDVKAPKVAPYLGGSVCAIGGIAALFLSPLTGITWLFQGALLILFAIFFKQLDKERAAELEAAESGEADEASNISDSADANDDSDTKDDSGVKDDFVVNDGLVDNNDLAVNDDSDVVDDANNLSE